MPEPVSTLGACCLAGYTALSAYARGRSAVSSEALIAQQSAIAIIESAERSQVLFGEKATAISQLGSLANDCDTQNWDGNDSMAIDPLAVIMAERFVRALPASIPLPEFAAEPDGSVSLDWIQAPNRLFSLSLGANQRLAYAWIDGADKGHGVARFDGERIPRRIIEGICGIMNYGTTIGS